MNQPHLHTAAADEDDAAVAHCFSDAANAQMERMVADFGRMYRERNEALNEVARAHHDALLRLARAAEFRDDDTGMHIVRIGYLAWALALRLGWPPAQALLLRQAAPMHDVGKIGIPDEVLKKPGRLTPAERAVMNEHPRIGAEILGRSRIPLFQLAAEVALAHHERWDGTGYPSGLAAEAIPHSGRIVAVVDFYDALTMDRCYRPAFSDDAALDMLLAERGNAFDPAVVDALVAHRAELMALRDAVNLQRLGLADLSGVAAPALQGRWPAAPPRPYPDSPPDSPPDSAFDGPLGDPRGALPTPRPDARLNDLPDDLPTEPAAWPA